MSAGAKNCVFGTPAAGGGRVALLFGLRNALRFKGLCPSACGLTPEFFGRDEGDLT